MKASYYNVLTENPLHQGFLLYNTMHKSLCELTAEEKRMYARIAMGDGDAYPLCEQLSEGGFVLENPVETEARFWEYQYDRYKYNTEVFELVLATTMDCNNRCVYCYETPRPGYMREDVQDAIMGFVEEKYAEAPYKKLKITWQGGEPLLRMDVIERLSKLFIDFCDERGVTYIGHVISNGRLATEENAKKLADLRVSSVMTSLDGRADKHDCRRCTRSGVPSYDDIIANFDNLREAGIVVNASFILERNNVQDFHEVGNELIRKPNTMVRNTQLRDYRDSYEGDENNRIDLTTRPEYSDESFRFFMEQNPTSDEIAEALDHLHTFCGTPLHNWWAIDELGNVYKCSGEYGDNSRVIFNLMEPAETRKVNWDLLTEYMNFNPTRDEQCRKCRVLPLCQGECAFEHIIFGRFCRTFLYNIEDYVQAYYTALVRESEEGEEWKEEGDHEAGKETREDRL